MVVLLVERNLKTEASAYFRVPRLKREATTPLMEVPYRYHISDTYICSHIV